MFPSISQTIYKYDYTQCADKFHEKQFAQRFHTILKACCKRE